MQAGERPQEGFGLTFEVVPVFGEIEVGAEYGAEGSIAKVQPLRAQTVIEIFAGIGCDLVI